MLHQHAHDALSDVEALISVTRLIKEKQPQLYNWLFKLRDKRAVQKLINLKDPQPIVYSCGRYSSEHNKTSVVIPIAPAKNGNVLVFDLRCNLNERLKDAKEGDKFYPVVKELKYNHCPAVAPISVLDQGNGWDKIGLSREQVALNLAALKMHPDFIERMREQSENSPEFPPAIDSESALYDGFLNQPDRTKCLAVRRATRKELADFHPNFDDDRLPDLLLHYKARNFENTLSEDEAKKWEEYRMSRIKSKQNDYIKAIQELSAAGKDAYILEELQLWYQSLLPY